MTWKSSQIKSRSSWNTHPLHPLCFSEMHQTSNKYIEILINTHVLTTQINVNVLHRCTSLLYSILISFLSFPEDNCFCIFAFLLHMQTSQSHAWFKHLHKQCCNVQSLYNLLFLLTIVYLIYFPLNLKILFILAVNWDIDLFLIDCNLELALCDSNG